MIEVSTSFRLKLRWHARHLQRLSRFLSKTVMVIAKIVVQKSVSEGV